MLPGMAEVAEEVGIGPDAEIFTKAQPMSAVGTGADVGIHPKSEWNNPEPEVVLEVEVLSPDEAVQRLREALHRRLRAAGRVRPRLRPDRAGPRGRDRRPHDARRLAGADAVRHGRRLGGGGPV